MSVFSVLLFLGPRVLAQENPGALGPLQLQNENVKVALSAVREFETVVIDDQVELCEIPAPPFSESMRAEAYRHRFEQLGLTEVRIDAVGNVIGVRAGKQRRPNLVMSAHLDTVFPQETDVSVVREGAILKGPGIGDDCRGLAVLLGIIRALDKAGLTTTGTITFVGTVGEEGLGDLRGVKHLFSTELAGQIDRFVSIDGPGLGITNGAVGSIRYRVTFSGPGGHSFGAFGLASPVHALGRFISRVSDFEVPDIPKTTFTVGRVGGGTSVNAIASEAWAEIDLRSSNDTALDRLDLMLLRAVDLALGAENSRWGREGGLSVDVM
ncbi:MAG: M20/M25/M40 family metallo-hydrolase, partial [Acidobacteriota bacterium]|nr:M20/M25/M40 family metallo-hydrolase [Acidobacteriota bacterium]